MIQFDNLTKEQRDHLCTIRLVWAMVCQCECGACRAMFNELQRICGDGPMLCPHGMPLAENICGPCSQGRPNRPTHQPGEKHEG